MRSNLVKVRYKAERLCWFRIRLWGRMAGHSKRYHFLIGLVAPQTTAHNQGGKVAVRQICLIKTLACDSNISIAGELLEDFVDFGCTEFLFLLTFGSCGHLPAGDRKRMLSVQ